MSYCGEHGTPWTDASDLSAGFIGNRVMNVADTDGSLSCADSRPEAQRTDSGAELARTIRLEWKRRTHVPGAHQTLAFRVVNISDALLPEVRIELSCEQFVKTTESRRYRMIPPGGAVEPLLGFRCEESGSYPALVIVEYKDLRSNWSALEGELEIEVTVPSPGGSGERVVVHIGENAVADFSNLRIPRVGASPTPPAEGWTPIHLVFNPTMTDVLRHDGHILDRPTPWALEPTTPSPVTDLQQAYLLTFDRSDITRSFLIHGQGELRIGRHSNVNDVVAWFMDPSGDLNRDATGAISRQHAVVRRQGERSFLVDLGSACGTMLASIQLQPNEPVALEDRNEFVLSNTIRYRYRELRDLSALPTIARGWRGRGIRNSVGLRQFLRSVEATEGLAAPLLAIGLRRLDPGTDRIDHLLLVRRVVIGSEEGCAVRLQQGNLAERHAQLVAYGGALWIEDLNSLHGTWVNGKRLASHDRHKIEEITHVRFGELRACVSPERAR